MKKILLINAILSTMALASSNLIEFNKEDYKFKTLDYLKSTDTRDYLMTDERGVLLKGSSFSSDNKKIETKMNSINARIEIEENGLGLEIQASDISQKKLTGEEKKSKEILTKINFYKYENEENYLSTYAGIGLKQNKILDIENEEYTFFIGSEYGLIKQITNDSFLFPYMNVMGSYTMAEDYEGNNTQRKEDDVIEGIIGLGIDYKLKLRNFSFITGIGYNYIYSDKNYNENSFEEKEKHNLNAMVGVEYIIRNNISLNATYKVHKNGEDKGNLASVGFIILF